MGTTPPIKSDETLIQILETLAEEGVLGVTELCEHLPYAKGTVHKHLKTMEQHNYVRKDDRGYSLGLKFLTLGGKTRYQHELWGTASTYFESLSERTDETATFAVKERHLGVFLAVPNTISSMVPLGYEFHLHENAAGKAILAELSEVEVNDTLDRTGMPAQTENTITDRTTLFEELDAIRTREYAINLEERREGISAVSAAVVHPDTDQIGAISLSGPAKKFSDEKHRHECAQELLTTVNQIENQIKYG